MTIKVGTADDGCVLPAVAAVRLAVSEGTLMAWAERGLLEGVTVNGEWRFSDADLARYERERRRAIRVVGRARTVLDSLESTNVKNAASPNPK